MQTCTTWKKLHLCVSEHESKHWALGDLALPLALCQPMRMAVIIPLIIASTDMNFFCGFFAPDIGVNNNNL